MHFTGALNNVASRVVVNFQISGPVTSHSRLLKVVVFAYKSAAIHALLNLIFSAVISVEFATWIVFLETCANPLESQSI